VGERDEGRRIGRKTDYRDRDTKSYAKTDRNRERQRARERLRK